MKSSIQLHLWIDLSLAICHKVGKLNLNPSYRPGGGDGIRLAIPGQTRNIRHHSTRLRNQWEKITHKIHLMILRSLMTTFPSPHTLHFSTDFNIWSDVGSTDFSLESRIWYQEVIHMADHLLNSKKSQITFIVSKTTLR